MREKRAISAGDLREMRGYLGREKVEKCQPEPQSCAHTPKIRNSLTKAAFLGRPMKLRSHEFSIYLLKPGVDINAALDEEHELTPARAAHLPPQSLLYLLEGESELWWPEYLGLEQHVRKNRLGAVLFVKSAGRLFAITFGQVSHQLCDESFEREFGLRVTLNSIDPDRLKATDTISPATGRFRRTQLPIETDLTVLDFDQNTDVLKNLTGRVREEFRSIFSSVSGCDYVRVRSDVTAPRLGELCAALLKLSRRSDYKKRFPQIGKIARVTDPAVVRQLDSIVATAIEDRSKQLGLSVPSLTEFPAEYSARFAGGGGRKAKLFDDVSAAAYFDYLDTLPSGAPFTIETLRKSHKLVLEGTSGTKKYPIHKCIVFEANLPGDGAGYHLLDGQWYRVAKDYVQWLQIELDVLWAKGSLPEFNGETEGAYNKRVAKENSRFACLDTSSFSPVKKHRIEPSDLVSVRGKRLRFWHVKRSTLSFMLSHLFCQGAASMHLLKQDPQAIDRLKIQVEARASEDLAATIFEALDRGDFHVVFAIVTDKDAAEKSRNLPLFSKITLRRTAFDLRALGVTTSFEFVQDVSKKRTKATARKTLARAV